MSFEEKVTWMSALITLVVVGLYAWNVGGRFGQVPVDQIAYQRPLLSAVGAMILFTIVGTIVLAIGSAIGAEITGRGSADHVGRCGGRAAGAGDGMRQHGRRGRARA